MAEGHAKSVLRSEEELPQSGQDGQNGRCSHPPNPGAPRRAVPRARPQPMATPQAYPLGRTVRRIRSTKSVRAAELVRRPGLR
jgi:hypothetical protein